MRVLRARKTDPSLIVCENLRSKRVSHGCTSIVRVLSSSLKFRVRSKLVVESRRRFRLNSSTIPTTHVDVTGYSVVLHMAA